LPAPSFLHRLNEQTIERKNKNKQTNKESFAEYFTSLSFTKKGHGMQSFSCTTDTSETGRINA
jgi:hypothetical protein